MHYLKKNNSVIIDKNILFGTFCICICYLFYTSNSNANAIEIEHAAFKLKENTYYLDATLNIDLSEESKRALQHGIALQFHTQIKVNRIRAWIWDKIVVFRLLNFKLQHHPLSGHYIVTNLNTGKQNSFKVLDSALRYLGTIQNTPVFENTLVNNNFKYNATIRTYIDIESLPAPMRPIAYLSSEWRLSSNKIVLDVIL